MSSVIEPLSSAIRPRPGLMTAELGSATTWLAETHDLVANRIEVNPKVMLSKPVIRGTRITVELVLRKLGKGASEADLLDAYPHLTAPDIRAAIKYAADVVAHEDLVTATSE